MQSPVTEKNFVKVFILYLLWQVKTPLDFITVNDIVLQDGYVNYFDFAECFRELVADGHVIKQTDGDGRETYMITKKGINVAENLSDDIFSTIRDRSRKSALRLISFKERGAKLEYECEDIPDSCGGGYNVTCAVLETGKVVCSVTVRVDTKSRADVIKKYFYENPEAIYKGSLAVLSGDLNFLL